MKSAREGAFHIYVSFLNTSSCMFLEFEELDQFYGFGQVALNLGLALHEGFGGINFAMIS